MKNRHRIINIILLSAVVIFGVFIALRNDASKSIEKAMKKHYYVGYVHQKAEYLYFGENNKVGVGTMVKGSFVMTSSYQYKVSKKGDQYILSFHKRQFHIQKNDNNLPERLFGMTTKTNYTLKD